MKARQIALLRQRFALTPAQAELLAALVFGEGEQ